MHSPKRLKITDVNPHLICVLCGGYYVDATTVIECLHSFCKSCIVKYLEKNKYCPICDVQIHKTTPLINIRSDKTLQNIVYKLVPSLFKNEMQRRVEFYEKHPGSLPPLPEQRGEITDNAPVIFPEEVLIICLEYKDKPAARQLYKRYLNCPAALTISHLIKLIKGKFSLTAKNQVHMFYKDEPLMEHLTLMDIAYTYQCRRKVPIHLSYKILELKRKTIRIINCEPKKENQEEKQQVKEWKEVQLQISENGVMSVRNVESCECSPIPAVEAPPVYSPSVTSASKNNFNHSPPDVPTSGIVTQIPDSQPPDATIIPVPVSVGSQNVEAPVVSSTPLTTVSTVTNSTVSSVVTCGNLETVPSLPSTIATPSLAVTASSTQTTTSVPVPIQQCVTSALPSSTTQTPMLLTQTTALPTLPASLSSPSVNATVPQPFTATSQPIATAYTVPGLPSSLPALQAGMNNSSLTHTIDPSPVTTMASMKNSTNLVPANFSIMSTSRTQSEPIVSVSKVSKDQVRKPNNVIEVNKLSISRVHPGGMKEKGEALNKIVNKLSPNERVIGNTSVTIRPVSNTNTPKMYPTSKTPSVQTPPNIPTSANKEKPQAKYKTLKSPALTWNPSIDRTTMLLKHSQDPNKPSKFFKMRNMPRFLGNPASGVKPIYACPDEPPPNQQNKQKLTLMKVDPKTIPTSSIPRSPTKQPPPYTPGSPKMSKPPPAYPDPKPFMTPRMPSPAHAGSFLPPTPYHLLYNSYPGFSHEPNRLISPELIRSMCAFHPSLPPSLGMLFSPAMHTMPRQDGFKPEPTPAVQRIPPSKTETSSPKPNDDKRFPPSPVGPPQDNKKLTPPPPSSPKDNNEKPPVVSREPSPKDSTPEFSARCDEVKENQPDSGNTKNNNEESNSEKINCDEININNNNSKESPLSQPSECLATRPQL